MGAVQQVVDTVLPYLLAAIPILGAAGLAWLRRRFQVEAATESELDPPGRGPVKKFAAKHRTVDRLAWYSRPLTEKGLDRLVESAVPRARERAAERRSSRPGAE